MVSTSNPFGAMAVRSSSNWGAQKEPDGVLPGSFGTYPTVLRPQFLDFQVQSERRPDSFIRYEYPKLLDKSREAVAKYLNAPTEACVFVPNATTGINTVLRNLDYAPGDVIIYFETIYGACGKTITYLSETTPVEAQKVSYTYPISDDDLCAHFEEAINAILSAGKKPKLALFDTIASLPGVRMPFERLLTLCKKHSILSCVDGAHGAGHIPIDLTALDPDFFVSNCHKWLHVPRGCAVFYVPVRYQHLMRSTLPTSHGFEPRPIEGEPPVNNPLPPSGKSAFVTNFEFVGTIDNSPYLCVPAALEWRKKLSYAGKQGEEAIVAHNQHLARRAGEIVSAALGTEVMENAERTLGKCNFAMVRLPLSFATTAGGDLPTAQKVGQWIVQALVEEYKTFIAIIFYADAWWVRLSAEVYLGEKDFEWGAQVLREVCARVETGDWKDGK